MKQRLLLIVVGGFITCYLLLVINAAIYQFINGTIGAYDTLPMAIYLGPFYAGLFSNFVIISGIMVFNKLPSISLSSIAFLNAFLAQISITIYFFWDSFVIEIVENSILYEKLGTLLPVFSVITPFILSLIVCVIGYRRLEQHAS